MLLAYCPQLCADRGVALAPSADHADQQIAHAQQQRPESSEQLGTGKTYVACALAHQACRKGHRAIYRRAARLFSELVLARADGTYARLLAKIARADVLVIDDFAMTPITDNERRDLFEVLDGHMRLGQLFRARGEPKKAADHLRLAAAIAFADDDASELGLSLAAEANSIDLTTP